MGANFESPALRLKWAHRNIDIFHALCDEFVGRNNKYVIPRYDRDSDSTSVRLVFTERPSEEMREVFDRIVTDLRSALDQAVQAAAKAIRGDTRNFKYAVFPFAQNEKALRSQLANPNGPYREVPPELHGIILKAAPFPREPTDIAGLGNNALCLLNDLANPQKHEALLETGPATSPVAIHLPPPVNSIIWHVATPAGNGEYELIRLPGPIGPVLTQMQFRPTIQVSFNRKDGTGVFDAPGTLGLIGEIVESIVFSIEKATDEALASRP